MVHTLRASKTLAQVSHHTARVAGRVKKVRALSRLSSLMSKPEGFFLVFSSLFGFMFVFLTPPMQVYDERVHFLQSYAVSNLDFVPKKYDYAGSSHYGAELPVSVFLAARAMITDTAGSPGTKFNKHLYRQFLTQPLNPSVTDHQDAGTGYTPVVYTPQALGITVGKIFKASPLIMIWLGRLGNLIAWVAIVYAAIRLMPFGKWVMAILALNPMAIFLSASFSADVMTTALAFLFFALVAGLMTGKAELTKKRASAVVAVLALMALTKPTNVVFGLLLFAIPWKVFGAKRKYIAACLATIILAGALAMLWNHVVADVSLFGAQAQSSGKVIDPNAQLSGIIHAPFAYLKNMLFNYILVQPGYPGNFIFTGSMGVLGWGEFQVPTWALVLYVGGLFTVLLYSFGRDSALLSKLQKTILSSTFILFFIANVTALYLYTNGVGSQVIIGVQGRYFIPGLPLLAGVFTMKEKILSIRRSTFVLAMGLVTLTVLSATAVAILTRFYIMVPVK